MAESIEAVDARGAEGIDIRTKVDDLDTELARLEGEIQAFETANSIDIDTDVDRDMSALFAALDRDVEEVLGRAGVSSVEGFATRQSDLLDDLQGADLDFGGFNVGGGVAVGGDDNMQGGDGVVRRLKRKLSDLSDEFKDIQKSLKNFDIRMSDIHNLMATLVPLLIVFIGAVPAVVTALIGLAAAAATAAASLAAIAGFGALGVGLEDGQFDMQNLTDVWEDIRESFIEAFAPLAERLEPLFMDAVDGLELFFQAIASQGDALMELTDEARAFGGFLMDFFPGALTSLAAMMEALAPLLSDIGEAVDDNFNAFIRQLVFWTDEATPVVAELVQTIVGALPALIKIGIQFARVADAALEVIGGFWTLITLGGLLTDELALVIATGLTLLTFLGLLIKILKPLIVLIQLLSYEALAGFVTAMGAAIRATAVFAFTAISNALSAIVAFSASIVSAIPVLGSYTLAQFAATAALASFITLATLGAGIAIVGMAMSAASGFLDLAGSIDQATSSLKEFDRVSNRTSGGDFNPYGGSPPSSGAGAAQSSGGSQVTINMESSGDPNEDASNARYVSFRQGRTTGGTN